MRNSMTKFFYLVLLPAVLTITIPQSASATPMEFLTNGHFYEIVYLGPTDGPLQSWDAAKIATEALGGYLATVTSAAEQSFLEGLPHFSGAYWAGGRDMTEGVWLWETGPEAGTQFWSGGSGGSTTLPDNYANWFTGEPNNSGNEDYLTWNISSGGAGWNDVGLSNSAMRGYIVEFNQNPIPEPTTMLLLGTGLVGVAGAARRRKKKQA